jgi:hypothetical protein
MIQQILIIIIFFAALFYLGYMLYKNFSAKEECGGNCGCSKIDLDKIEKEILSKK